MNNGKRKCELLKNIRQEIANKYGLKYTLRECLNKNNCIGTCPLCDAELVDLQKQLKEKGIDEIQFFREI